MAQSVQKRPERFHSVTPHIVVGDGDAAIAFYTKAFGAEELFRMAAPDGRLMHAEIMIGDSVVMIASEMPECGSQSPKALGGTPVALHVYVDDVDQAYDRAVAAGATGTMPPEDMFWGDRYGRLEDPFGHVWSLATHIKDPTPEEMEVAAKAAFSQ